jgi:8-oxo-dGTP diphosphatase
MVVAFVRHAHAGSRSTWTEDDRLRPLSLKGRGQAAGIAATLQSLDITALLSSPYLRCIQTLEPMSDTTDIPITIDDRLAEDTPFEATLSLLEHVADGAALCSHGDVIPATIDALVRRGMLIEGPAVLRKGSMYLLHREGGRFSRAEYVPPPVVV